jgi:hydroxypyruvate reductase
MAPNSKLRRDAIKILQAGLEAVDSQRLVRNAVARRNSHVFAGPHRLPVRPGGRIYVFGAGKAAAAMALAIEGKLDGLVAGGLVITKPGYEAPLKKIQVAIGSHPQPGAASVRATRRLLNVIRRVESNDDILFVWSGGASALLFQPRDGITVTEKIRTISKLMDAGADIHELNAVRKHLSAIKGGQLARHIPGAPAISMILSDVCGDNPATIASGPAFPDDTTFGDAIKILKKYQIWTKIPRSVRGLLQRGDSGKIAENPRVKDRIFRNKRTILLGTSRDAVDSAAGQASKLGYETLVLAQQLQGDTEEAARLHVVAAAVAARRASRPLCLLSGGETTIRLTARHGKGGRNLHFTLAAALLVEACRELHGTSVVLSAGTDGTDGPTEAAGAIADHSTLARAARLRLDPERFLKRQDSYTFFKKVGDLVITGPTNTNVMDLRIVLVARRS